MYHLVSAVGPRLHDQCIHGGRHVGRVSDSLESGDAKFHITCECLVSDAEVCQSQRMESDR